MQGRTSGGEKAEEEDREEEKGKARGGDGLEGKRGELRRPGERRGRMGAR